MCFDGGGVDHLRLCGSSIPSKFAEQIFPDATASPAHKAVIDGRMWAILGRAIAPAAPGPEHVNDSADEASIVLALNATHIRWQMRLNPLSLFVIQPEEITAHDPGSLPKTNQNRIVAAEKLMSFDPSSAFQNRDN